MRRLRKAAEWGSRPSRRDELLLRTHHGHMGKKGDRWSQLDKGWDDQEWAGSKSSKWRFWPGTWGSAREHGQPPWKKGKGRGKEEGGKMKFPAFDSRKPEETAIIPVTEKRTPPGQGSSAAAPTLVGMVQQAVNSARKLDSKVARLRKELSDGRLQWDAYVSDLKAALRTEKARYLQGQERLTKELSVATELQAQAYQQLSFFQQSPQEHGPVATEIADDPTEWNEILRDLDAPADQTDTAALGKLFQALQKAGFSAEPPEKPAPVTPQRRTAQALPHTPPHAVKTASGTGRTSPPALGSPPTVSVSKDPYMSSPGLAHFGIPSPASNPVGNGSMGPAATAAAEARDECVPAEGPGMPGLAERLSERRRAKRSALAPFGVARTGPQEATANATTAQEEAATTGVEMAPVAAILEDDDTDELEELDTASPGFGNLE